MPLAALDFLNKDIGVGDTIIYPVRRGSAMWLRKMTVEAVVPHGESWRLYGCNDTGHRVSIDNLETCVVVEKGFKL